MTPDAQPLEDHVRIWQVDPLGHTDTLVRVAHDTHVTAGLASLTALSEQGEVVSRTRLSALVSALAEELGMEPLTGAEAQEAAVAAMARRVVAGEISPRELTYWVTRVVGLRGGAGAHRFLSLEQDYCDRLGEDVSDLDATVLEEAAALLTPGPSRDSGSPRGGRASRWLRRPGRPRS